MAINLNDYEDVNSRVKRFRTQFPDGRIVVAIIDRGTDANGEWVLMEASIYCTNDQLAPTATDYAHGHTSYYRPNMKRWYVEDTSTSAIGRALGLVIPSEHRPTRENMEQVERFNSAAEMPGNDPWANPTPAQAFKDEAIAIARTALADAGFTAVADIQKMCVHGERTYKAGVNKAGGKWEAYFCPSDDVADKCATIGADGKEWKRR
jgi:hypothetical protein